MSTNHLKDKIKGHPCQHDGPVHVRYLRSPWLRFVRIDCEHSALSLQDVLAHLNAVSARRVIEALKAANMPFDVSLSATYVQTRRIMPPWACRSGRR